MTPLRDKVLDQDRWKVRDLVMYQVADEVMYKVWWKVQHEIQYHKVRYKIWENLGDCA